MLESYKEEIKRLDLMLDSKQKKRVSYETVISLSELLIKHDDKELESMMYELKRYIESIANNEDINFKDFKKLWRAIETKVGKDYGYVTKGSKQAISMSLGMSMGTAIGVALSSQNPVFLSVGIGCGIAIGAGIGALKEKEAVDKGLVY